MANTGAFQRGAFQNRVFQIDLSYVIEVFKKKQRKVEKRDIKIEDREIQKIIELFVFMDN